MTSLQPTITEYTVGWICAISEEYIAARQMLDERHDTSLLKGDNDQNQYTCGRIGKHNVVVACLPVGSYGTVSAARVATTMKRTFPFIRFGLMVGIAGGAPSTQNDVRLGDVVVSTRVVPYTPGRVTQDHFAVVGSDPLPPFLGSVVSGLMPRFEEDLDLFPLIEPAFETGSTRIQANFRRPSEHSDRLYISEYIHTDDCDCMKPHASDISLLKEREPRPEYDIVKVHHGSIGSADQVLMNAEKRDRRAMEHRILCFETESAGFTNNEFPVLPIRGISDYADSHKGYRWHHYAAASAAVCAKELLKHIAADDVSRLRSSINEENVSSFVAPVVEDIQRVAKDLSGKASKIDSAIHDTARTIENVEGRVTVLMKVNSDCIAGLRDQVRCLDEQSEVRSAETKMMKEQLASVKEHEKEVESALKALQKGIKEQQKFSMSDDVKNSWQVLQKQVDGQVFILGKLIKTTGDTLSHATALLGKLIANAAVDAWKGISKAFIRDHRSLKSILGMRRRLHWP